MLKRFLAIALVLVMAFSFSACKKQEAAVSIIPEYEEKQFEISGFWAPYEISEESFQQYKDVGFTTLAMINHSLGSTSEEQFYLGSERTMKALEICDKVGLNAILNYNDWMVPRCEEEGYDFYGETPFTKFDIYGDYKDIITGIHICDEPHKDRHIDPYSNSTLVEDFKKVYPDADYIVNLIPFTAYASRGFESYDEMMQIYEEKFMEPFGNKSYVSVDVYPFHQDMTMDDGTLLINYQYIANSAKKYGVKPAYILQSSVGGADEGRKEFEMTLSEADLRWEVYNALAFGADTLQYYCYSVPKSFDEDGNPVYMYDNCILNRDDTPSDIYYSLQKIHKEIQSFASAILAYDWDTTIGVSGTEDQTFRISALEYDSNFDIIRLKDCKNFVDAKSTLDMVLSRYISEKYGEAYMFLNWADRDPEGEKSINVINAEFKDCNAVAVYGGADYNGTPKIIDLEDGKVTFELAYGEGIFVTPITK
ncbi:MAG: hypothetical protein IJE02_05125 [Clostridia bacterium]|nr:hypothetical protein [Clostridia bacterium]